MHLLRRLFDALDRLLTAPPEPKKTETPGKQTSRAKGDRAERLACNYLRRHGYRIVERNWTCARGELDIIASRGDLLVVVEVKSGKAHPDFRPARHVNRAKQKKLWYLTRRYLQAKRKRGAAVRLDIVEVVYEADGTARVEHLEAAVPDVWRRRDSWRS